MAKSHRAAAALLMLGALSPAGSLESQPPAGSPTVAVMYFNNGAIAAQADYEPLRAGLADILITELQSNPRIVVVERDALQKLLEEQNLVKEQRVDPETSARLGKILGAQHMILGGFVIDRQGRMRIDARAVNVETSRVEHVESVNGAADDVFGLIASLSRKLNDGLKLPARPPAATPPRPPSPAKGTAEGTRPKVTKFQAVQTYARAVTEENNRNRTAAVALYRQFLEESPADVPSSSRARAEARIRALTAGGD